MRNFAIHFQYPWLLLLLIPAFALTFFLYFRLNKKFRKTRNRVISIVLHCIVMVLCTLVLAGMTFSYEITNASNEILLLVDVSDTEQAAAERRDEFVDTVLTESSYDGYKVGVVTFGFTQVYAAPLSYDTEEVREAYRTAPLPDTTATDIAAALKFAQAQLEHPETSKIILITDGEETDESAASVVLPIAKRGTIVDTVYISAAREDNVQIVGVNYPEYHINQNEEFTIGVSLQCKEAAPGTTVELFDNGLPIGTEPKKDLPAGDQIVTFTASFAERGLHEITVKVTCGADGMADNNTFCSYYYLDVYGSVLILEHKQGESRALAAMLAESEVYAESTNVVFLEEYDRIPTTVNELRAYDQVILNNISNHDLQSIPRPGDVADEDKDWFVKLLYSYVEDYGGGLFTVGGMEDDGQTVHAYNREDMYNSLYQELLPVQAVDYVPPVGVMLIIDVSGSMSETGHEKSPLYYAKEGAVNCLYALNEGDYIGVMTLDKDYSTVLPLTRCSQQEKIREVIRAIEPTSEGTIYSNAIQRAGESLKRQLDVDKRHIVLVTDGMPSAEDTAYLEVTESLSATGVTLSIVGVNVDGNSPVYDAMQELATAGGGKFHTASGKDLLEEMKGDLLVPEMKEFKQEAFYPVVSDMLSPLLNGGVKDGLSGKQFPAQLEGFFGVKKRESADMVLMGEYEAPIYAQWSVGKGMVGSFMCDLNGSSTSWSSGFMADELCKKFLFNVIANLMPTEDIRPGELRLDLKEDNYTNRLNIYLEHELEEGQYLEGKLVALTDEGEKEYPMNLTEGAEYGDDLFITTYLGADNSYTRCNFVLKRSGVYRIVVTKFNADGTESASKTIYKAFSYSEEYDTSPKEDDPAELLAYLAELGGGEVVPEDDPWSVFGSFVPLLARSYDPRLPFIITAMVLFLLDIAVRKFKFKWIHELVRERKARKAEARG